MDITLTYEELFNACEQALFDEYHKLSEMFDCATSRASHVDDDTDIYVKYIVEDARIRTRNDAMLQLKNKNKKISNVCRYILKK